MPRFDLIFAQEADKALALAKAGELVRANRIEGFALPGPK
jgi:hypothetical protein